MPSPHLTTGSTQPPKDDPKKWRLYSMEYCPYAHRARLVLNAKGVLHDVVNINLINKPEWYFNVHPEGKVPALDTGSKIVVESLDIADFIDQQYPDPPLYSAEPQAREQEKELIKKIGPLTGVFANLILSKEKKSPAEWLKEFLPHLEVFENELTKRNTPYFGGQKPGMVDYMLWPWAERAGVTALCLGERLPIEENQLPKLRAWRKLMQKDPVVDKLYTGPEKFHKVILFKTGALKPDYDNL